MTFHSSTFKQCIQAHSTHLHAQTKVKIENLYIKNVNQKRRINIRTVIVYKEGRRNDLAATMAV